MSLEIEVCDFETLRQSPYIKVLVEKPQIFLNRSLSTKNPSPIGYNNSTKYLIDSMINYRVSKLKVCDFETLRQSPHIKILVEKSQHFSNRCLCRQKIEHP